MYLGRHGSSVGLTGLQEAAELVARGSDLGEESEKAAVLPLSRCSELA